MSRKEKVIFLSAHNSARSQMAEGLLRHLYSDRYLAFSAGVDPREVDPLAVEAMAERGIDISRQRSKSSKELWGTAVDVVAKIRDFDSEACPLFPSGRWRAFLPLEDPSMVEDPAERRRVLSAARDRLERWIVETFGEEAFRKDDQ
ncbi:arsenate reductase ArsC [Methanothrix harundinacea]|uniref:Protein ArsC (Arsenate reductase) (Arsenical pumpmodifier) n=1 Tax=Methanothrix harundinacea (strain 6Ac) TaxID=1110509 RepID=G7WN27_METH6|nr:arsenate reductase ArsC [Methanothrix harundinacea]AET63883.1 Protein ArsC (Arsenate reductase) (Arsenical pumpmodifier) [Methanothrix harundinacea 6Ac]